MATPARYSREDMADMVAELHARAVAADAFMGSTPVHANTLHAAAAMLSEAANRAPTHQEFLAGQHPREERRVRAAERLCSIYWDIAVAAVGEDEVRRRRDEAIARIVSTGAQA